MLSNSAWGAARAGVPPGPFFNAIAPVATQHLRLGPPALTDQHVCNVAWAFARAEARSPEVLHHMQAVGEKLCQEGVFAGMQSHHAAGTTWALMKVFTPDQQSQQRQVELPQPLRAAVAAAASVALANVATWRPRDLVWVSWSVARAFARDEALALLPPVVARLATVPASNMVTADFTMVSWAIASAEMSKVHFRPGDVQALVGGALQNFRSQGARATSQESILVARRLGLRQGGLPGPHQRSDRGCGGSCRELAGRASVVEHQAPHHGCLGRRDDQPVHAGHRAVR